MTAYNTVYIQYTSYMLGLNMIKLNFKYFQFFPNQLRSAFKLNRMRTSATSPFLNEKTELFNPNTLHARKYLIGSVFNNQMLLINTMISQKHNMVVNGYKELIV